MCYSGDWAGGTGEEDNPYIINSRVHLEALSNNVGTGEDYQGVYFLLAPESDIDLSANPWTPIGDSYNRFNGNFDGNGCAITGLNFLKDGADKGLFGTLGIFATVKNLKVNGIISIYNKDNNAGILAGSNCGSILNCHCEGEIEVNITNISGDNHSGIITGTNDKHAVIKNSVCRGKFKIFGNLNDVTSKNLYWGGLAGLNLSDMGIADCEVALEFDVSAPYEGLFYIGSLCGYNKKDAKICNCLQTVHVKTSKELATAAGLFGKNDGSIEKCKREVFLHSRGNRVKILKGGSVRVLSAGY